MYGFEGWLDQFRQGAPEGIARLIYGFWEVVGKAIYYGVRLVEIGLVLVFAYAVLRAWLRRPRGRPVLETLDAMAVEIYLLLEPWVRRAWNSKLRKDNFSWTEFKRVNLSWRNFFSFRLNKWSRMRMYFYVAILAQFLISAYLSPASLRNLTRIACFAIESAWLGNVGFVCKYEKAVHAHSFQAALRDHYDLNRNGRLEPAEQRTLTTQTGLSPRELTASCVRADLRRLVIGAHKAKILPGSITYGMLLKDGYDKGVAEHERRHKEMWAETDPYLQYYWSGRELLTLDGWKRGIGRFYEGGYGIVLSGAELTRAEWMGPVLAWLTPSEYYARPSEETEAARAAYENKMEAIVWAQIQKQRAEDTAMGSHSGAGGVGPEMAPVPPASARRGRTAHREREPHGRE
jgi:hypothetical protein